MHAASTPHPRNEWPRPCISTVALVSVPLATSPSQPPSARRAALAADVRRGLLARPRSLPPKWFYDDAGSELFDRICDLPEYYLTRAERGLLAREADAIVAACGATELFEIGSGSARKTGLLLEAMARRGRAPRYMPFDISRGALDACGRAIRAAVPGTDVAPVVGDFERDLAVVPLPARRGPRLFAFLGSTVGNLDERAAPALVREVASRMEPGDAFLVGFDLVKPVAALEAAYDDAAGVTAAFNKNVLAVLSRELDADFDLARWIHRARFSAERSRIEMHLESACAQRVRLASLGLEIAFEAGERILTEISRKFTRETAEATLRAGGLRPTAWLTNAGRAPEEAFALALAEAP